MKRRGFIALVGGAVAWPMVARAQQATMPVVALIHGGVAAAFVSNVAAFRKGLGETGYAGGQNVTVEYYWLEGHYERLPALLDDLARRRVAVIATPGSNAAALAAKSAIATIPIVVGVAEDPVAMGLVASLDHPGGNLTGINFFGIEVSAKRLGLMHELLPKANRFAVLVNPTNVSNSTGTTKAFEGSCDCSWSRSALFQCLDSRRNRRGVRRVSAAAMRCPIHWWRRLLRRPQHTICHIGSAGPDSCKFRGPRNG
jgi:putative ABC transport system substrate-binding protein